MCLCGCDLVEEPICQLVDAVIPGELVERIENLCPWLALECVVEKRNDDFLLRLCVVRLKNRQEFGSRNLSSEELAAILPDNDLVCLPSVEATMYDPVSLGNEVYLIVPTVRPGYFLVRIFQPSSVVGDFLHVPSQLLEALEFCLKLLPRFEVVEDCAEPHDEGFASQVGPILQVGIDHD
jgi:hypothetical protein